MLLGKRAGANRWEAETCLLSSPSGPAAQSWKPAFTAVRGAAARPDTAEREREACILVEGVFVAKEARGAGDVYVMVISSASSTYCGGCASMSAAHLTTAVY